MKYSLPCVCFRPQTWSLHKPTRLHAPKEVRYIFPGTPEVTMHRGLCKDNRKGIRPPPLFASEYSVQGIVRILCSVSKIHNWLHSKSKWHNPIKTRTSQQYPKREHHIFLKQRIVNTVILALMHVSRFQSDTKRGLHNIPCWD